MLTLFKLQIMAQTIDEITKNTKTFYVYIDIGERKKFWEVGGKNDAKALVFNENGKNTSYSDPDADLEIFEFQSGHILNVQNDIATLYENIESMFIIEESFDQQMVDPLDDYRILDKNFISKIDSLILNLKETFPQINFDFSKESLTNLDWMLDSLEDGEDLLYLYRLEFVAYIGEVYLNNYPGQWSLEQENGFEPMVILKNAEKFDLARTYFGDLDDYQQYSILATIFDCMVFLLPFEKSNNFYGK